MNTSNNVGSSQSPRTPGGSPSTSTRSPSPRPDDGDTLQMGTTRSPAPQRASTNLVEPSRGASPTLQGGPPPQVGAGAGDGAILNLARGVAHVRVGPIDERQLRAMWNELQRSQPFAQFELLPSQPRGREEIIAALAGDDSWRCLERLMPHIVNAAARLYPHSGLGRLPRLELRPNHDVLARAMAYASMSLYSGVREPLQRHFASVSGRARHLAHAFFAWGDAVCHSHGNAADLHRDFVDVWNKYVPMIGRFETLLEAQLEPHKERPFQGQLWVRLANNFYTPMLGRTNVASPEEVLILIASQRVRPDMAVLANCLVGVAPQLHQLRTPLLARLLTDAYSRAGWENHPDFVEANKAARKAAAALERAGESIFNDDIPGVVEACTVLHAEVERFAASIGRYDEASKPRTMQIPGLNTAFSEAEVRAYLLEERLYLAPRTKDWKILHDYYFRLSRAEVKALEERVSSVLQSSSPDLRPAFRVAINGMEAIRSAATRVDGPKARAVAAALNVGALHQRFQEGTLATEALYNACLAVLGALDPDGIRTADFRLYAGYPIDLLPRAMHETYTAAMVSMHLAWHERDEAVLLASATSERPGETLFAHAIAFEKARFHDFMEQRYDIPLTDDWLASCTFDDSPPNLGQLHAEAIANFIVMDAPKYGSSYPEVLRPYFDHLSGAIRRAEELAIVGIAEATFRSLARRHRIPWTDDDCTTLQENLMQVDTRDLEAMRERVASLVISSLAARLAPTQLAALAGERKKLIKNMTIFTGDAAHNTRLSMVAIITNAVQRNRITHGAPTPWLRAVTECGERLRKWAEVDWLVHGSYYKARFKELEEIHLAELESEEEESGDESE